MAQKLVKPIDIRNSALNSEAKSTFLKGFQIIHKLGLCFDSVIDLAVVAPHIAKL